MKRFLDELYTTIGLIVVFGTLIWILHLLKPDQICPDECYEDMEIICCPIDDDCDCVELWIDGTFMFRDHIDSIRAYRKRFIYDWKPTFK